LETLPAPSSRLARRLGPFRHRPFTVYWLGGVVSNVGTWLQTVAAAVFVYERTGSALAVGILNFASFLPIFLFSIAGGVIGDRFDRRTVVVVTHAVSGLLAAVLAGIAFTGVADEASVIVIAFLLNATYAVAKPALVAILPAIVPKEEITDAVGVNTLQFVIGQMAGPILAAVVIAQAGIAWAFAVNALSYLAPIVAMAYLWRHKLAAGAANRVRAGVQAAGASAVTYVREHRWVVAILIGVVSTSAPLEVVRTLTPAIAVGLGQPESAAGFLVAAQSIGSAIALLAFVPLRRSGRSGDLARVGLVVQAVGLLITVLAGEFWLALLAGSFIGFGFSLCFPVLTSALQAEVPDAVRGRIMSYHQMFHLGNRPFAALAAGAAAVFVGAQAAVGIGLLLTPVGLVASRRAWRALAAERLARDAVPGSPAARPTDAEAEREEAAIEAVAADDLLGVGSGATYKGP
jgi:MFS family permease